jgi:hypothetical protein
MSGAPSQLPPPSNPHLLPVLAAVTYVALIVAAWGGLSLALDREVIGYSDAGPLLGPAMAAAAGMVTWFALRRAAHVASVVILAMGSAAASYSAMVTVGAVGYAAVRSSAAIALLSAAQFCVSPFVIVAALLSAIMVVGLWAFDRGGAED